MKEQKKEERTAEECLSGTAEGEAECADECIAPASDEETDPLPETDATGIYGDALPRIKTALGEVMERVAAFRRKEKAARGEDPVEHCLYRIKSDESMREKCRRKGLPETKESALGRIHDAVGIRVVCAFLDDVFAVRDDLVSMPGIEVIEEKDYIRHAKPNGYRSYHMILRVRDIYVEVQLRTISMDTWAALEHQLRYKKVHCSEGSLIFSELKRCADELASTDISMQTIRDMIRKEGVFREGEQP